MKKFFLAGLLCLAISTPTAVNAASPYAAENIIQQSNSNGWTEIGVIRAICYRTNGSERDRISGTLYCKTVGQMVFFKVKTGYPYPSADYAVSVGTFKVKVGDSYRTFSAVIKNDYYFDV